MLYGIKLLGYEQEDVIKVALLCTIYIIFLIIKFIHKGKIKFFWKALPNVFIVIFLYHLFTISTAILMFLYDPLAGCYVASNLTKKKIMSLKTGQIHAIPLTMLKLSTSMKMING